MLCGTAIGHGLCDPQSVVVVLGVGSTDVIESVELHSERKERECLSMCVCNRQ